MTAGVFEHRVAIHGARDAPMHFAPVRCARRLPYVHATTMQHGGLFSVVDPVRAASIVLTIVDQIDGATAIDVAGIHLDTGRDVVGFDVVCVRVGASGRVATERPKRYSQQCEGGDEA
jgi:hypothetical protein